MAHDSTWFNSENRIESILWVYESLWAPASHTHTHACSIGFERESEVEVNYCFAYILIQSLEIGIFGVADDNSCVLETE